MLPVEAFLLSNQYINQLMLKLYTGLILTAVPPNEKSREDEKSKQ